MGEPRSGAQVPLRPSGDLEAQQVGQDKGFAEWGDVLGDTVIATAILDRLLHHSHVISIRGESYRLREKKRAGLFSTPAQAEKSARSSKA